MTLSTLTSLIFAFSVALTLIPVSTLVKSTLSTFTLSASTSIGLVALLTVTSLTVAFPLPLIIIPFSTFSKVIFETFVFAPVAFNAVVAFTNLMFLTTTLSPETFKMSDSNAPLIK